MRPPGSSLPRTHTLIWIIALSLCTRPSHSAPDGLYMRQTPLTSLKLPQCALSCYLGAIIKDGCSNEVDFACHCKSGNLAFKASACIEQGCNQADEADAYSKLKAACKAMGVGGDAGGNGNGNGGGSLPGTSPKASSPSTSAVATPAPAVSTPVLSQPMATSLQPSPIPIPATTTTLRSPAIISSTVLTRTTTSTASQTPLAPLPQSDSSISEGAKAGISVSVTVFALSVFFALGWYIRRLKRDLRAAQVATGISEDAWRTHISTASAPAAPAAIARNRSWSSSNSSRRGRRTSRELRDGPVSPLSPRSMSEITTITDNGYGVLKKKRGNVLSIVVEGSEEDTNSLMEKGVREPVPGQREGLSAPLELDGEWTGVVEMPLAITPRNRSLDRDREGKRPGTGGK